MAVAKSTEPVAGASPWPGRGKRARRMEALGKLAGGVAHDLNNMLGPLVAYPDLLLEEIPEDGPFRSDILSMQRVAERAAALVRDLLALARRGTCQMVPLNLNSVVMQYLCSPSYTDLTTRYPDVRVDVNLASTLLSIQGSAPHLFNVIMNLVSNAFEAMPRGGKLSISTSSQNLARPLVGYSYVEAGDYVVLQLVDTGVGIEDKDVDRIFEPFYTKKEMGRSGSGLGLAIYIGENRRSCSARTRS